MYAAGPIGIGDHDEPSVGDEGTLQDLEFDNGALTNRCNHSEEGATDTYDVFAVAE